MASVCSGSTRCGRHGTVPSGAFRHGSPGQAILGMSWHGRRGKDRLTKVRNGRQGAEGNRSAGNGNGWCARAGTGWLGTAEHSCFGMAGKARSRTVCTSKALLALERPLWRGKVSSEMVWSGLVRHGRQGQQGLARHGRVWTGLAGEARSGTASTGRARLALGWQLWQGYVWNCKMRHGESGQATCGAAWFGNVRSGRRGYVWSYRVRHGKERQPRQRKASSGGAGRAKERQARQCSDWYRRARAWQAKLRHGLVQATGSGGGRRWSAPSGSR